MKTLLVLVVAFLSLIPFSFSQPSTNPSIPKKVYILLYDDGTWEYAAKDETPSLGITPVSHLEIPKTAPGDNVISHTGYSFLFGEQNKQSKWIAYELTSEETNKLYDRTDKFLQYPAVKSGTATDADYASSGYDKGHLAPAAHMGWSSASIAESSQSQ
jgi:endonuclease G